MGSIGGRFATPFLAPYCASKFALEAIGDALRVEVHPWRLHVAIVEPGSIATPIWGKSDSETTRMLAGVSDAVERDYGAAIVSMRRAAEETGRRGAAPETVAAAVEHALLSPRPKTRYVVGTDARIQAVVTAILPDRVRDFLIARALKLPR
jgi:NAD(P)-dependent dehydrogenase (short-subunit alcohol dehydrogenase family)